jgi:hypothetical protein
MISGYQINFQPAVVIDSNDVQVSYQQIYFVQAPIVASDQPDSFVNATQNVTACFPNPCQNSGFCQQAFNNTFACICKGNFRGKSSL